MGTIVIHEVEVFTVDPSKFCNRTVIYYMHTFFVAAEVENTNEIFLNLVT